MDNGENNEPSCSFSRAPGAEKSQFRFYQPPPDFKTNRMLITETAKRDAYTKVLSIAYENLLEQPVSVLTPESLPFLGEITEAQIVLAGTLSHSLSSNLLIMLRMVRRLLNEVVYVNKLQKLVPKMFTQFNSNNISNIHLIRYPPVLPVLDDFTESVVETTSKMFGLLRMPSVSANFPLNICQGGINPDISRLESICQQIENTLATVSGTGQPIQQNLTSMPQYGYAEPPKPENGVMNVGVPETVNMFPSLVPVQNRPRPPPGFEPGFGQQHKRYNPNGYQQYQPIEGPKYLQNYQNQN